MILEQDTKALLARAQRLLGPLALGSVHGDCADGRDASRLVKERLGLDIEDPRPRAERERDLAPGGGARLDHPLLERFESASPVVVRQFGVAFADDCGGIEVRMGVVYPDVTEVLITERHDDIASAQGQSESPLALPERVFALDQVGDVDYVGENADRATIGIYIGGVRDTVEGRAGRAGSSELDGPEVGFTAREDPPKQADDL